jgi:hypothetical protein
MSTTITIRTDRRGFRTYRTRPGKALRLVLDEGIA